MDTPTTVPELRRQMKLARASTPHGALAPMHVLDDTTLDAMLTALEAAHEYDRNPDYVRRMNTHDALAPLFPEEA